jgi:RNA polymerase sigma-70 factor (ECF subfamily)
MAPPQDEPCGDGSDDPADNPLEEPGETAGVAHPGPARVDWVDLVNRIRGEDSSAMEELYRLFSKGIRFYLCRQLGPQELDDKIHDIFLVVIQAIRRGELREPERLMGFVRTVVRRQVAAHINEAVHNRREFQNIESGITLSDRNQTPEERVMAQQRAEMMETVLRSISRRDREILTRFYLLEETQEQICSEMHLTETQFRLLKSRAKARFGELGKKKLVRRSFPKFFLRKVEGFQH